MKIISYLSEKLMESEKSINPKTKKQPKKEINTW